MFDYIDEVVSEIVKEMVIVNGEEIGLDNRVGRVYINDEWVCVNKRNKGSIDYYGGFEYIDKEFVKEYGDYVFYSWEHERVSECISNWEENKLVKEEE